MGSKEWPDLLRTFRKKLNKLCMKPPTHSPSNSSASSTTDTAWNYPETLLMSSTRRETSALPLNWLISHQENKKEMGIWSTSAWAYAIRRENGSMRQKKEWLSSKEKLKPNFIMVRGSSANWPQKTWAELSSIRQSTLLCTASHHCWNTQERPPSKKTSTIAWLSHWSSRTSQSRPRKDNEMIHDKLIITSTHYLINATLTPLKWNTLL